VYPDAPITPTRRVPENPTCMTIQVIA
jgi:hypothetical protein